MSAGECDASATGQSGQDGNGQNTGESPGSGGGQSPNGRGLGDGTPPGDTLYVDTRIIDQNGKFQMSQYGDTDDVRIEMLTLEAESGEKMDYKEVVALYEKQALRELKEQAIPVGMETVVKDYFTKINQ